MSSESASRINPLSTGDRPSAQPNNESAAAAAAFPTKVAPSKPAALTSAMKKTSPSEAAQDCVDKFVQTLLFAEQRSILQDYAVCFIELFAVFYCDSKNLLQMKEDTDNIPNNCKITVPLQPVDGVSESPAYKALANEVASFSKAIA